MIHSLLFFPEAQYTEHPRDYFLNARDVTIPVSGNEKLFGWMIESPKPRGVILFFHGNAGNISGRLFKAEGWIKRGYSVLLYDYRGYGQSTGTIQSDEQIVDDARAVLKWLEQALRDRLISQPVPNKDRHRTPIILYGESLGTYPAIRLAAENKDISAVILEAPYTAFTELAPVHYPWIPRPMVEMMLKQFSFKSIDFAGKIKAPVFILHGTVDPTCPFSMGEKIYEEVIAAKEFWTIQGGAHNDLPSLTGEAFWDRPAQFLQTH